MMSALTQWIPPKARVVTTSTGVQIGLCYMPPLPKVQGHMALLQGELLNPKPPIHWLVLMLWRWL